MPARRISDSQLRECVKAGFDLSAMARELGAAKSTVCERLQRLGLRTKSMTKRKRHLEKLNKARLEMLKKKTWAGVKDQPNGLESDGGTASDFKQVDLESVNKPFSKEEESKDSFKGRNDLQFTEVLDDTVKINGVEFSPNPDVSFKNDVEHKSVEYKFNYVRIAKKIVSGEWGEINAYRELIRSDLWFVLFFIVKPFSDDASRAKANHSFTIQCCREVEEGPKDFTLDLWARYHYKSSIVTIAETIQFQLQNPECVTGIFSHKSPIAKDFLFSIREIFQNERILAVTYPDVVWEDCKREAGLWSLDEGIILKRKTSRKEASISGHGLLEGSPTGLHFERRIYDDISTNDIAGSFDTIQKVNHSFDISQNLKTLTSSHHRIVGTFFSHNDPLVFIRDKKDLQGNSKYHLRLKPATHDGTATGKPVLMSQEALDELKGDSSFNCQQLLDPTPSSEQRLNPDFLQKVLPHQIPQKARRFMLIDQAGDADSNKGRNTDPWAMGIFAVEPVTDDIGQSKIFIENLWCEVVGESEGIEQAVRMYIEAGIISQIGVEKVGLSSTHIHIANALKARGRHINFSEDRMSSGILLRPAGRNKKKFIESACAWPLNNSKWFYSSDVPSRYIDRLKQEMQNFPLWHDDCLNVMGYLYDILRDYHFPREMSAHEKMLRNLEQNQRDSYSPLEFGLNLAGSSRSNNERDGQDYDVLGFGLDVK